MTHTRLIRNGLLKAIEGLIWLVSTVIGPLVKYMVLTTLVIGLTILWLMKCLRHFV